MNLKKNKLIVFACALILAWMAWAFVHDAFFEYRVGKIVQKMNQKAVGGPHNKYLVKLMGIPLAQAELSINSDDQLKAKLKIFALEPIFSFSGKSAGIELNSIIDRVTLLPAI